jgi:DNA-binding NarL/FixJ family response regulator
MAQGKSNVGIARALFLSPKTVETYVAVVFDKLGLTHQTSGMSDNRRVLAVLAFLEQDTS